jgi:hypothetical protein
MRPLNPEISNDRIKRLQERQERDRLALHEAVAEQRRRQEKQRRKLVVTVGEALLEHGERTPSFKTALLQLLSVAVSEEKTRAFLRDQRWLDTEA